MNEAALKQLTKARAYIQFHEPYFGTALWAIRFVEVKDLTSKAGGPLATDFHWRVYYDPTVVEPLTIKQAAAALSHELHHMIRGHKVRANALGVSPINWKAWNVCGDAEINDDLQAQTHIDFKGLPFTPITPELLGQPPGLTAEVYYRDLPQKSIDCGHNCGSGAHGVPAEWETQADAQGVSKVSRAEAIRIQKQISEDLKSAKHRGTAPAGLVRWAEALGKPTVDWTRRLANKIRSQVGHVRGRFDYTYAYPNRRQHFYNFVMPAMVASQPRLAIVIDTSGSMSDRDLAKCLAETKGVLDSLGISFDGVTLFSVDAEAHAPQQINSIKDIRLKGGGGTDMRLGIQAANAHDKRLDVIIVMTDGYTPWPASQEGARVIACLTQPESAASVPGWIETVIVK